MKLMIRTPDGIGLRRRKWQPPEIAPTEGKTAMQVVKLGSRMGARIRDVDVRALDDASFAPIYQAWLDHAVIVVPGQELSIDDFLTYSRRFGRIEPHPSKSARHPDYPEVTVMGINKFDADGNQIQAVYRRGASV